MMNTKMNEIDDEIRQQLETANNKHLEHIRVMERNREVEVERLKREVGEVEEEMKVLLREKEVKEEAMREKMRKVKDIFNVSF